MFLMLFAVLFVIAFIIGTYLKIRRKVADVFGGNTRGSGARGDNGGGNGPQPQPARPSKKIDPSVGEYVEFEEVQSFESTRTDGHREVKFESEEQITDVEWEEVK